MNTVFQIYPLLKDHLMVYHSWVFFWVNQNARHYKNHYLFWQCTSSSGHSGQLILLTTFLSSSCLFRSLKLWTFLSQTPEQLQLKIFLVQLFFHIKLLLIATLLPFCCSSNKKQQQQQQQQTTVTNHRDNPLPITMSLRGLVNRLIQLWSMRFYCNFNNTRLTLSPKGVYGLWRVRT